MSIVNYIKRLLPVLNKGEVFGEFEKVVTEFDKIVLPSYKTLSSSNLITYKSNDLIRVKRLLSNYIPVKNAPLHVSLYRQLLKIREVVKYIDRNFDDLVTDDLVTKEANVKEIMTIRLVEHCVFISQFSMDLLNFIYDREIKLLSAEGSDGVDNIPKITVAYLNRHVTTFGMLVKGYSIPLDDFEKRWNEIPLVKINERNESTIKTMVAGHIDPFLPERYVGFVHSLIFYIRLNNAVADNARYEAMKARKASAEFRLLHLKNINDGEHNPKLAATIDNLQADVDRYEQKIKQEEEKVGLDRSSLESAYSTNSVSVNEILAMRPYVCKGGCDAFYHAR